MKITVCLLALLAALSTSSVLTAQATVAPPAGAPAGTTALCVDGTYSKSTSKLTACLGHKGIQTWYGAPPATTAKPAPTTASTPAPSSKPVTLPVLPTPPTSTTKPSTAPSGGSAAAPAPGGAPNLVWLNTASKVFHCYGTQYYGKTKAGAYMTSAQAIAQGGHLAPGEHCQ